MLATVIRVEVEEEDIPRIKAELSLDREVTPDDLTTWSLQILERHFQSEGGTTKRIDFNAADIKAPEINIVG